MPIDTSPFELNEVFVVEIRDGRAELTILDSVQLRTYLGEFSVGELSQRNPLAGQR